MRLIVAWLAVALAACGGAGGDNACTRVGIKICDKACACSTDGKCRIANEGATLTFDERQDCIGLLTFACTDNPNPTIDLEACSRALDGAACVGVEGGAQMALDEPPECTD